MVETDARSVEIDTDEIDRLAARAENGETLTLTRNGRPVAALVGVTALERWTDERELLRRLALGELESAAGEGDDLDRVLETCRQIIEGN